MIPGPEGHNDIPHFDNFSPDQFEKLILDLIRAENPGTKPFRPGSINQQGFAVQVTFNDGTKVFYEGKQRRKLLRGAELKAAVARFLDGEMVHLANVFCVITSGDSSSTVKHQKLEAELACEQRGIKFEYESREGLWSRLREYPEIVDRHLNSAWADESRSWCQARLIEKREQERREQQERIYSDGNTYRYEDGYFALTFLLPSAHQFRISAAIHFKTEQLEGALITLSNDDVLNTFDESAWFDEKPLLASKYGGRAWAQIGNVRIELTHAMLSK